MDLAKLSTAKTSESGSVMYVKHPVTGELLLDEATGEHVSLTLLGADSKAYQTGQYRIADKRLNSGVIRGKTKIKAAELAADSLDLVVMATRGWAHVQVNGEELPFNEENVRLLYTSCPWLREQAEEFIGDRANFLGNSPTPSPDTPNRS